MTDGMEFESGPYTLSFEQVGGSETVQVKLWIEKPWSDGREWHDLYLLGPGDRQRLQEFFAEVDDD